MRSIVFPGVCRSSDSVAPRGFRSLGGRTFEKQRISQDRQCERRHLLLSASDLWCRPGAQNAVIEHAETQVANIFGAAAEMTRHEPHSPRRSSFAMRDFALEAYFSQWQSAAHRQLAASDSETLSMAELVASAGEEDRWRWGNLSLGYTNPRGADWLRVTIAGGYETLTSESVRCFAGAQEGIFAVMHALLGAADHAIIVTPNYQSAETVPAGICAVTGVGLDPTRSWSLDIDAVAATARPNTRLISINFPNNPTGKILERDRFDALIAFCRKRGIWLFSDEVYRLIERDPARRLPAVVDAYERGISLGGVSKPYGLPGLRVGWIACRSAEALERFDRVRTYLSICNAAPSEVLAQIALKAGDRLLARNRRIAARNLALLTRFFDEREDLFEWHIPDGGVVGYPRYRHAEGVEVFCRRLVERHGVMLLPASVYGSELLPTPTDRFRIGFGRRDFAAGLAVMEAALDPPSVNFCRA
jgi:aspartate/methionine/tyrosine aminotransferase